MENVIFDTNGYRDVVKDRDKVQVTKLIAKMRAREKELSLQPLASTIVASELLSHLADKNDPAYSECLKAVHAMYLHCSTGKNFKMIASPELQISNAFFSKKIKSKVITAQALSQILMHFSKGDTKHVRTKFQHNLNKIRNHIDSSEGYFAYEMQQFVKTIDPASTGWRIHEHDEQARKQTLQQIRSVQMSRVIALGYLFAVYQLLVMTGEMQMLPNVELWNRADAFVDLFKAPIALKKQVMENLVNSDFNILENNRTNFIWDIMLMFNLNDVTTEGNVSYFVTSDKAIIRAALASSTQYRILTFSEYLDYIGISKGEQ